MKAVIKILVGVFLFTSISYTGLSTSDNGKVVKDAPFKVSSDTILTLELNNDYKVIHLNLGDRKNGIIRILKDREVIGEILLPIPDVEVKNFMVNKIEENNSGFAVSVNWGGGKSFYSRKFQFDFEEDRRFYLKSIEKSFYSSESEILTATTEYITPPIKADIIKLSKYITND